MPRRKRLRLRSSVTPWALITGATSGLGREIAMQLAQQGGYNLAITGRRADALKEVAVAAEALGAQVLIIEADLALPAGVPAVIDALEGRPLGAAILNAGVTQIGAFEAHDEASYQTMIDLNVSSAAAMSHALLPALKVSSGRLMLVASLGGVSPLPYQSVYAGTKAFLVNFGLSLAAEAETAPARVTVFAPGGIDTPMTARREFAGQGAHLADPADVAAALIKALHGRKTLVIPGWQNKGMAAAVKILPRRWIAALVARSFRRSIALGKARK